MKLPYNTAVAKSLRAPVSREWYSGDSARESSEYGPQKDNRNCIRTISVAIHRGVVSSLVFSKILALGKWYAGIPVFIFQSDPIN